MPVFDADVIALMDEHELRRHIPLLHHEPSLKRLALDRLEELEWKKFLQCHRQLSLKQSFQRARCRILVFTAVADYSEKLGASLPRDILEKIWFIAGRQVNALESRRTGSVRW